ncbi:cytochrome-ba3 oxidase subunit [Natronobeatus ordinarius]|uniref:cytochrome-ba3 oxidase subunit n=1 Tax=Natronobeatus ordinarius TaxID=2963433 RepID=UPI0020CDDAC0|nr:cytochrome-ba3 oxidase subunit [Natronobeatus ordinarius]
MASDGFSPRYAVAIGLLAILPALVYATTRSMTAGGVTAVNVVIIFLALYTAMGPIADESASVDAA